MKKTRHADRMGALVAPALLVTAGAPLAAQEPERALDEIVITAQKREQSLQDVPISVNAVSGDKLVEAGIVRLDELRAYVPNLQVTETGIANNFYVRGIGSGLNHGFEQSVSIYADGIYRGRGHQSRMPFLDLERVEVLRGPQPILFGKNAIAGAVSLISARPTQQFEGSVRALFESETGERLADVVVSGPLTDTLAARFAGRYRETDGYTRNLTLGRDEPQREEAGGRFTLAWEPNEIFDATLKVEAGSFDVDGRQIEVYDERPAAALGGRTPPIPGLTYSQILRNVFQQDPGVLNTAIDYARSSNGDYSYVDTEEAALTMNLALGNLTLTSVTGYSAYEFDEFCDCDFTGANVFTAGVVEDFEQMSQELRLTSPLDQRLSWIAGLFYQDYDHVEADYSAFPANSVLIPLLNSQPGLPPGAGNLFAGTSNPRVFEQDSELFAVFAQGTWSVTERLRLTAGGRWTTEDKRGSRTATIAGPNGNPLAPGVIDLLYLNVFGIQRHSVTGERSEDNFSPLLNLQYQLDDDTMGYLSWARGYKAGGFDARSNRAPPFGTFEYEDEEATTYELGVKTGLGGGAAELNAAVFYTDYEDLQTSAFDGRLGFNVGNGSAEVRGVELEARWRALDRLLLAGSVAWLDFEWTEYIGQCYWNPPASIVVPAVPGNCNYAGFSNQLAPEITAVATADYSWPIGGSLELRTVLDVVYSDEFLLSLTLDPRAVQDAYAKLNARVSLGADTGRWELALVGRNLTDEEVISYAGDVPLSGSLFLAPAYYGFVDPPRTLAIEGTLRF